MAAQRQLTVRELCGILGSSYYLKYLCSNNLTNNSSSSIFRQPDLSCGVSWRIITNTSLEKGTDVIRYVFGLVSFKIHYLLCNIFILSCGLKEYAYL